MEQQHGVLGGRPPASLTELTERLVECRTCPRLVAWREEVAATKRAAFADDQYWGRPVPGFGDPDARIVVVGLAPAAHGANRTGRMFTGDRSGEWLYRALHRAGLASSAMSTSRDDGLVLDDVWITAPVRCAPPANRPTPSERDACAPWFDAELALLRRATVALALGRFAYESIWRHVVRSGADVSGPRPAFGHGSQVEVGGLTIVMSYHVSQQNTFTGRLTEAMLDDVVDRCVRIAANRDRQR